MQLTKINMQNKFAVIIEADWNDADYITKLSTFDDKQFKEISAFITIIQDVYNKQDDIQEWLEQDLDIREYLELYIRQYLKHYLSINILDINENAICWITDELYDFMPPTNDIEYPYPHTICDIKIIKDSEMFEVSKPTDDDVKKALGFISTHLQK